jgi:CheY-like chemotaxis protein
MSVDQIYLIHWNEEERKQKAAELRERGYDVIDSFFTGSKLFSELEKLQPKAILIDLTRIPSQGRDLGIALRKRKGTRQIPIVFVGGKSEKVEKIKGILPDAGYCDWDGIQTAIAQMSEISTEELVVPDSVFAASKGKAVSEKLGISEGHRIFTFEAPDNVEEILSGLPSDVVFVSTAQAEFDLAIWFARSEKKLKVNLDQIVAASKRAPIWIAWPKKKSGNESDLTQKLVREICMGAGMVDYKVCSISQLWSGLLFTWRGFELQAG